MAKIELVKGASYTDGVISASRKAPVIEVPDEKVQRYVGTGFFRILESTEPADSGEDLFADEDEGPKESATAVNLRAELSEKTVGELVTYAATKGIDITGLKKKAEIIDHIVEAQEKAYESRADLRSE